MSEQPAEEHCHLSQLRLLLEELCCEICWLEHFSSESGLGRVRIDREVNLGRPGSFADIRVAPIGAPPYVIEVKFGYSAQTLISHLRRKYGESTPALASVRKLILVVDADRFENWDQIVQEISAALSPGLELEVWRESHMIELIDERFKIRITSITPSNLLEVRQAIDRAQGYLAYGGESITRYI